MTDMTDPDWEPVMKKEHRLLLQIGAVGHAMLRLLQGLGVPAIVGCGDATTKIESEPR